MIARYVWSKNSTVVVHFISEIVLHVWGNAVAPAGVLRHVHPLGNGPRCCLADGGARGPKVLPAAELESMVSGGPGSLLRASRHDLGS